MPIQKRKDEINSTMNTVNPRDDNNTLFSGLIRNQ